MEITNTEILESLLDGVDPFTGEILDESHVCCRPEVMRALHHAVEALRGADRHVAASVGRQQGDKPDNAGAPWTAAEEKELENMFLNNLPLKEIASRLGRTRGGIRARMVRLGLIKNRRDYK